MYTDYAKQICMNILIGISFNNYLIGNHDTLTLLNLNNYVRPEAASQWRDLGMQFLNESKLDIIEKNLPGDVESCCTEVFKIWLKEDTEASWAKIVNALRAPSVELYKLADDIEKRFGKC